MNTASLAGAVTVPFLGALMCAAPALTRPTLQFGVRVPRERAGTPVIGRERRAYYWRTGAIGVCAAVAALALAVRGTWWLPRIILLLQLVADLGCYLAARRKISAAKNAGNWFAGLRQTVVADTSWRTDPPRFPVGWLVPAIAVLTATAVVGVLRYPDLPGRIAIRFATSGAPDRWARKSPFSAFAMVVGQGYVTVLWTGLLLIIHRSRPDLDAASPATSTRRYRRFLSLFTRAVLTLLALVNLSLLLEALRRWQVYRLSGSGAALPLVPFVAGMLILVAVAVRTGQGGSRLGAGGVAGPAAGSDRDDDRFWKGGLIYVNRGDAAVMVGARFGVGFTFNLGNPIAWLVLGGIAAGVAGLTVIGLAAGTV